MSPYDQSAFTSLWLSDMKFGAVDGERNCPAKEMNRIAADGKLAERK